MNKTNRLQTNRKQRVRGKLVKVSNRPRLIVNRTNQHIYAQIVDSNGKLVVSASDVTFKAKDKATKTDKAAFVGEDIAKKAKKAKISQVAFDRGYYKYHGRVKALAEAARSTGLEF